MVERIKQLIDYSGLSISQFADGIGVPRAILSHIMSGRNKPSLDVIIKVVAKYKAIDLNWLLLGEGEMLNKVAASDVPTAAGSVQQITPEKPGIREEEHLPEIDKIQNAVPGVTPPLATPQPDKQVKQIIFFYSDNSFKVYTPEV